MEPSISDLQAQIDRLSLAVHQGRETQGHLEPMAQELSQLTKRCTEILNRWAEIDQRHAHAVSEVEVRLGEWGAIESRLQQDAGQRIRELENAIEHEWKALRQIHEEPAKQLREQAAALGEICVSAANLALQGFERAEARLAALETSLQERLSQLSQDVHTALAEVTRDVARPAPLGAGVEPFPLEGVMRIHEELRESSGAAAASKPEPPGALQPAGARLLPEPAEALAARMASLEREVSNERQEARDAATLAERSRQAWRLALGGLGAAVLIAGVIGVRLQQRVNARLDDAATRVAQAERQAETASEAASRQIASTRADAEHQITEARQTLQKAEIVTNVLAAPDLVRFNLTGTDQAVGAYAQVLWSRSRGLVLSASRLPAAPEGSTYQIWFLTKTAPVSAGVFVPDSEGRASLVVENPPNLPRPVTDLAVTLESAGGQPLHSGVTVLSRAQQ